MDCFITFSKHLIMDYELGCRFFLFGFSRFLWLFLFFGLGMKFLYSGRFVRVSIRFLCDLRRELKTGFCSKNVLDGNKSKCLTIVDTDFVGESNMNSDEESDADSNEESEFESEYDVSILKKLLRDERRKAKVALQELAKERSASASAAEEAMAMILRLQNEKSLVELELNQYKRLAEEKQIHDQEVIRSLQWLVWRHESKRSLLEDQLKVYRPKRKDECEETEEDETSFNGKKLCCQLEACQQPKKINCPPLTLPRYFWNSMSIGRHKFLNLHIEAMNGGETYRTKNWTTRPETANRIYTEMIIYQLVTCFTGGEKMVGVEPFIRTFNTVILVRKFWP